jgi:hypothetical protein
MKHDVIPARLMIEENSRTYTTRKAGYHDEHSNGKGESYGCH